MPEATKHPLDSLSKDDKLTLRTGRAAKDFIASEFGRFYLSVLESHLAMKRNEFEQPASLEGVDGISQVLRSEANKGAIIALRLVLSLLPGMVSAADSLRVTKGLSSSAGDDE